MVGAHGGGRDPIDDWAVRKRLAPFPFSLAFLGAQFHVVSQKNALKLNLDDGMRDLIDVCGTDVWLGSLEEIG